MGCNVGIPPRAAIAPAVERTLGKGEVACSNHASSTILLLGLWRFLCIGLTEQNIGKHHASVYRDAGFLKKNIPFSFFAESFFMCRLDGLKFMFDRYFYGISNYELAQPAFGGRFLRR